MIAKLRKYYPKIGGLNNKSKALYLSLILNPQIKKEGLAGIGSSSSIISNIINQFTLDYSI